MSTVRELEPYNPPADPAYDLDRLQWRRALKDLDCRSLAYDYRIAKAAYDKGGQPPSEDLVDGWLEYKERFGGTPHSEYTKQNKLGRSSRKKRESPRRS